MKNAYVNFLNHCYVDTEVEMKEIYSSSHIWKMFDYFMQDMEKVLYQQSYSTTELSGFMNNKWNIEACE